MDFREAGLPNNDRIRQAFEAAQKRVVEGESFKAASDIIRSRIDAFYDDKMKFYGSVLDRDEARQKNPGIMRDYDEDIARIPEIATGALQRDFSAICIDYGPVRPLLDSADMPSPQLLAAAILLPVIQSDEDEQKVVQDAFMPKDLPKNKVEAQAMKEAAQEFAAAVTGLIHEVRHLKDDPDLADLSPEELEDFKDDPEDPEITRANLVVASDGAKTLYMAGVVGGLTRELEETKARMRDNPRDVQKLEAGREQALYSMVTAAYGLEPLLDRQLRDTFNQLSSLTTSDFRLREDRIGGLELIAASIDEIKMQQVKPKEKPKTDPLTVDVL